MTKQQMALLHLSTGHVVGVVSAGGRALTVADATAGSHVAVRIPDGNQVRVPADLLTARAVPVDNDVLTRPTHYRVTDATPPLAWVGPPIALAVPAAPSKPGREVISVWDGGSDPEVARDTLDKDGKVPTAFPPDAVRRLVAVPGEPLMYEP